MQSLPSQIIKFKVERVKVEPRASLSTLDRAVVDGVTWYTVRSRSAECNAYIRASDPNMWYAHPGHVFAEYDVHEHLYTLIMLQWGG